VNSIMKVQSADGVEGVLIFSGHRVYFRVYDQEGEFVDYDIYHSDLTICIKDTDAYFYRNNGKDILDHSPNTLGLKL
jgi:hypothetical protein